MSLAALPAMRGIEPRMAARYRGNLTATRPPLPPVGVAACGGPPNISGGCAAYDVVPPQTPALPLGGCERLAAAPRPVRPAVIPLAVRLREQQPPQLLPLRR